MDKNEEKQIEVSRTFNAPLEMLWKSWTEPEGFMKWYGPQGFTIPTCKIDLQVGGSHLWCMQSQDGRQMYFTGSYKEIIPMERLVFSDTMSDAEGNVMGMGEGMPEFMDVTVTFSHADGKTTVMVSHLGYGPGADYAAMGWEQAFDKLTVELEKG
ncbi:MAG: SRPBCC domain-containing protein [Chloroflexota bacterium]